MAGANRPTVDDEFGTVNVDFTATVCRELEAIGNFPTIIYSSSIHAERPTPYGKSKREAENVLREFADRTGAPVIIYRLPNVFGKWCRPNYNSAVATFCHNIANDLPITVHDAEANLSLAYIDDVVTSFKEAINSKAKGFSFASLALTYESKIGELVEILMSFRDSRSSLIVEDVGYGFVRALYATYLSYLPPEKFTYDLQANPDDRGDFVEILKTRSNGQISFLTCKPGITRGRHYHHTKSEKFLVVKGIANFTFTHVLTGETHQLVVSDNDRRVVETTPGWLHDITNEGERPYLRAMG